MSEGIGGPADRPVSLRVLELITVVPLALFVAEAFHTAPDEFLDWRILVWAAACAIVDLLPVRGSSDLGFSLSFPIGLAAALIYPPAVAAVIAFLGAADMREIRRELPLLKALYIRGQIAWSVALESLVFHGLASLDAPWWAMGVGVLFAAVAGYALNVLIVAFYFHVQTDRPIVDILRDMHVGVLGEFVISYMGLALFSVLVAVTTQSKDVGLWALAIFIAPLAFARQMFQRTHSLQTATIELAQRQAENEYQAMHDALTQMPNRTLFQLRLGEVIEGAKASGDVVGVMLLDLDHFKEINDTLGHHFGDQLLQQIGPRFAGALREHDIMARLGGDEFGLLLPALPDADTARTIAERLLAELEAPIKVEGLALDVAASLGVAIYPMHGVTAESLLRHADVAMYAAKETRGRFETYEPSMDRHNPNKLALVTGLRPAIDNNEIVVYYQPQLRLSDGRVAGAEALVRWEHPGRGLVPPDQFIPLVERTVLLKPFTYYVIRKVLDDWQRWADAGFMVPVAINVSPRSLLDRDFPEAIASLISASGVPAEFVQLELTESFMMADSGRSNAVLHELSAVGVGLSIDDFGTGYSSLSHLRDIPIDEIKIDRSFVMRMMSSPGDEKIVKATTELGRNLDLTVVAEGVEDRPTFDRLADFGCHHAQGYYISRPVGLDEFTSWLAVRGPESIIEKESSFNGAIQPGGGHLRSVGEAAY